MQIKGSKLTFLFILISLNNWSQAPAWQWAKAVTGDKGQELKSICTDGSGNVFITGGFSSTSAIFGNTILTNANGGTGYSQDLFIAKYSPAGSLLWAKRAGGPQTDGGVSLCSDPGGNILLIGVALSSPISFGNVSLSATTPGAGFCFMVKYDTSGNVLWAKKVGNQDSVLLNNIATDNAGDIYIAGEFNSDSLVLGNVTLPENNTPGYWAMFVAKCNASGNALWGQKVQADYSSSEYMRNLCVDGAGNVFITGDLTNYNPLSFSGSTITLSTSNQNFSSFLAKYNANGAALWAKNLDNVTFCLISPDGNGGVFLGASFTGLISVSGTSLSATDTGGNMLLARYDATGNLFWTRTNDACNAGGAPGVATDAGGCALIAGGYKNTNTVFGPFILNNPGVFVAKYDPWGNPLWVKDAPGNIAIGHLVCTGANSEIIVGGEYAATCAFDGNNLTTVSPGADNTFIAELINTPTGIAEITSDPRLNVFPNPFNQQATFQAKAYLENANLKLINAQGQIMWELGNIYGQSFVIRRNNLPAGIYCFRLEQEGKVPISEKLVIED